MAFGSTLEHQGIGRGGRVRPLGTTSLFCRKASRSSALLALLVGVAFSAPVARARAAKGEKFQGQEVSGIVTEITPQHITIQGTRGEPVTLTTSHDYTQDVAFGSDVTATYVAQDGVNRLETLTPPLENLFVPAYEIRERIRTAIVLPDTTLPGANELFDAMERYLHERLGWYIKPRVLAEEARRYAAQSQSTLDLINPQTGSVDISRYAPSRGSLARQIASATRVDAVIEARLVEHIALLDARRRVATWDGYRESASGGGGEGLGRVEWLPITAKIPAATLEVKLWDARGKPLWNRTRGLATLYVEEGLLGKLRPRPLEEVLEKKAEVSNWLGSFFAPLLAPSQPLTSNRSRP